MLALLIEQERDPRGEVIGVVAAVELPEHRPTITNEPVQEE
jgi:hypothetical protein